MENRGSIQQTESERRCQIEGCNDVTVGARTSLCRKHRNNKYKQNYKKRKRKAQGAEENQGESLESQLAVEKYHLEQKYASMLQQVLVQKRLELLQSPSIRSLLRIHQQTVRENKQKELMEKRKTAHNEQSSKLQQEKQSKQSKLQSTSEPSSSCANTNTTCNSGAATKSTSSPSKAASSNKTLSKSSKQSSRQSQGRNASKNSKHRNNSNSSIESSVNGLASNLKITSSNNNNSIGHPVYGSTGAWAAEKSEFCDLRHVHNFQQQQMASQEILHHPIQQALQQQNLQQQPQPPPPPPPPPQQQQQRQVSNSLQPELLLQLYQQHNMQKQQLQHLQQPNLLEHLHQKQLHERQEKEQHQQQLQLQQQQRLPEQLVQQQQQQQFVQQQRRLQQQQQQQQQQQELRLQLQNSRQQQQYKHQQMQQQQQQQQQQLQHQKGTGHQTRHQVQLPQQQQQHQHLPQQHQTCASSVTQSVNHVSSTEILFQNLPSIQSSMSNLLVSQSHINTSNRDVNSSAAISTTTRHSVLPRTILTNTQGRTQNCTPINHMISNTPSVTSHRPIAPRLEGLPNVNNTLCNNGMPIITAIISAPLTQQIMPQNASNVERNSIQPGTESNVLTSINSFGNPITNHYSLMPFNTQVDMNLLQSVGTQFSEQNVQCAPSQTRGQQMLLD